MVDAVIHSAGAYATSAEEIMAVNFHSCVRLLRAAGESGWSGSIVFLSSTAATYGRKGAAVYSASKAALNSLVEAESENLGRKGIRVNAVAPAKVATALQESLNPGTPVDAMIAPRYVAERVVQTLFSPSYGNILYLRKGEDT
jgi:NAD(P)-dependent dehydrogenase (short-subunit alcohol dehydrogenase family)